MQLLRAPLVHCLILGAMLCGVFALMGERGSVRTGQIVVTPGHIEPLTVGCTRTWQRPPTAPELAGLLDDYIHEEVALCTEAIYKRVELVEESVTRYMAQHLSRALEWDVKRLAASFVVAARFGGLREADGREAAHQAVSAYRESMAELAPMPYLTLWYERITAQDVLQMLSRS